ncbi:MAG: hypothetical protein IK997_06425 [Bacilli bacterium]|nr:hypothetical protein [Bacilli bacterium]
MGLIDLSLLHSNATSEIKLDGVYSIPSEYYKDTDVKKIDNVSIKGTISRETDDIDFVDCDINGVMILQDAVSLEDVDYPFSIHLEGNLEDFATNFENTLDISEFLWENIVLEIPLRFTKVEDLSKFHGDGWKLVSEEDIISSNNPFKEYLKNNDEEE